MAREAEDNFVELIFDDDEELSIKVYPDSILRVLAANRNATVTLKDCSTEKLSHFLLGISRTVMDEYITPFMQAKKEEKIESEN